MDTVSPERRSEIMARVRAKDTGPEWTVRRLIHWFAASMWPGQITEKQLLEFAMDREP